MKQTFTFLTLAFLSFGLIAFDAEAKRMGGGKNIGTQRQANQQQAAPAPKQAPAAPAAAPSSGSKWGGALAGLAAGGLLAALFMGGAFENISMMDIMVLLLLAVGVFFVIRMMRKPSADSRSPAMQYSGMNTTTQDRFTAPPAAATGVGDGAAPQQQTAIPADFDVGLFLKHAKASFINLQAANDRGDLEEIRGYTTPAMFAEISAQIGARSGAQQQSEVMFIDADLLEVDTGNDIAVASVRFTGEMRELPDGDSESFNEIWHVQKDVKDSRATWLLAGIQQVS
ncbi:MAG: Tim44-like domain-containing protein [Nitrosomonas sp.]|nr:MAG: Tim44-like domain-containing protein [Nitrosomonas sp.]